MDGGTMTDIDLSSYMLVKDKDGQLKYYKDGQFFSTEEMDALIKQSTEKQDSVVKKIDFKPVLTFTEKKKELTPRIVTPKAESETQSEIPRNNTLDAQRSADQKAIEATVKNIIAQLKISFSDEVIERRFLNILTTYFRGIRTQKEIEYVLALPRISGGMELPADKAKLICSLLGQHHEELGKTRQAITTKVADDLQISTDMQHRLEPPPPMIYKPIMAVKPPSPPARTMVQPPIVKPTAIPAPAMSKPVMTDVKPAQRQLAGPLEELEYMTLDDFRKLGRNDSEIREEVLERVMLLAEQSFVKKIQGVKAWRKSPVYKMYLMLSLVGIQENKTIVRVIEEKQARHEDCLTLSEFETISELNNKLRF
ncbi:MAG: hypothetical protein UT32_C0012G0007 [Parcubacteria group bacterium GW2011_GWC2_39_14]|nr:MAG: hypothetical protein UT32_C0012G0007 [Parcubacteria group bacterium GW2011_GWC2_39_14]KKR55178.1 MAG: hypothetical protein UT91_C0004G0077 [Parcubacteria group bacterium GW2011_GWA2_40_23]